MLLFLFIHSCVCLSLKWWYCELVKFSIVLHIIASVVKFSTSQKYSCKIEIYAAIISVKNLWPLLSLLGEEKFQALHWKNRHLHFRKMYNPMSVESDDKGGRFFSPSVLYVEYQIFL